MTVALEDYGVVRCAVGALEARCKRACRYVLVSWGAFWLPCAPLKELNAYTGAAPVEFEVMDVGKGQRGGTGRFGLENDFLLISSGVTGCAASPSKVTSPLRVGGSKQAQCPL